jgi:hypothetical protein
MGRARSAMELLALAEVDGIVYAHDRQRAVAAARDLLCDEFPDVHLSWATVGYGVLWQMIARCPSENPQTLVSWLDLRPEDWPGKK